MTSSQRLPVLIVGAGPTGLVLALWLQHLGTPFRIIDRNAFAADTSRAMVVHARTLEIYRMLGFVDKVIAGGVKVEYQVMWESLQIKQKIDLRSTGEGQSKYPFVLIYPQNRHEELLNNELSQHGIQVDREIELVALSQADGYVTATLKKKDGTCEQVDASYVVGCDGSSSRTRQYSSIEMPGGTYEHRFYVADTVIDTTKSPKMSSADMNLCFSGLDFTIVFPLPYDQSVRLIGICPDDLDPENITIDSLRPNIKRNSGVEVTSVNWLSTYKVQHRVASSFRDRNVFLCGDAAHVHSPVGGQGLNYSVQDATNLAWKLHTVCSSSNGGQLINDILSTYCTEREAHAHSLVNTTDRIFTLTTDKGWLGTFYRQIVMGYIVPTLAKFSFVGRFMFPRLSQTGIAYPDSKLSVNGTAASGSVIAGSRLPYITNLEKGGTDNHEPLNGLWQVQMYGQEADEQLKKWGSDKGVQVVDIVPTQKEAQDKGLLPGTICLLRPDGYIGYVSSVKDGYLEELERYAGSWLVSVKK